MASNDGGGDDDNDNDNDNNNDYCGRARPAAAQALLGGSRDEPGCVSVANSIAVAVYGRFVDLLYYERTNKSTNKPKSKQQQQQQQRQIPKKK